jgi:hypothetical protein
MYREVLSGFITLTNHGDFKRCSDGRNTAWPLASLQNALDSRDDHSPLSLCSSCEPRVEGRDLAAPRDWQHALALEWYGTTSFRSGFSEMSGTGWLTSISPRKFQKRGLRYDSISPGTPSKLQEVDGKQTEFSFWRT